MFYKQIRNFSDKSGWSWIKNRRGRKKIISLNYPCKDRSKIIKLNDESNKLIFISNGILRNNFINIVKNLKDTKCIIKNDIIKTPCLIFAKAKCHTLLEILTYDEVLCLEKMKTEILKGFEKAEKQLNEDKQNEILKKHEAIKFILKKK